MTSWLFPCGPLPGVRLIEINGSPVGVIGLDEILAEVRNLGIADEDSLKEELLARVKKRNYVSPGYEPHYREALWREYHAATASRKGK